MYRTCWNNLATNLIMYISTRLLQTCWQLGTSSANTTCWRLIGRLVAGIEPATLRFRCSALTSFMKSKIYACTKKITRTAISTFYNTDFERTLPSCIFPKRLSDWSDLRSVLWLATSAVGLGRIYKFVYAIFQSSVEQEIMESWIEELKRNII